MHFTPTYASWLNQVEIWFHIITQKAIRRGTFGSVKELVAHIERFVRTYMPKRAWTATADQSSKRSDDFVNILPGHNTSISIASNISV